MARIISAESSPKFGFITLYFLRVNEVSEGFVFFCGLYIIVSQRLVRDPEVGYKSWVFFLGHLASRFPELYK